MSATEWVVFGFSTSAKALLVLTVAYALTRLMRERSAAERHVVWMLASVCVLALPALSLAGPKLRVPARALWITRADVAVVAQPTPVPAPAAVPVGVPHARAHPVPVEPVVAPVPATSPTLTPAPPGAAAGGASVADESGVAPFLIVLWLVGFVIAGGRLLLGLLRTRGLTAGARPLLDPVLLVRAQGIGAELGVSRPVRYLEGEEYAMPITFGIVRARLLLPSSARDWTAERQEYVLRHELAHIRRRDSLSQLIAELGCALYWFNPVMWYAAKRMQTEREHACDDAVLRAGTRASDYAAVLLDIAESLHVRRAPALAAIAMARRSHLRERVTSVLDARVRRDRASARLLVPAWIGAFLLLTPLSSIVFDSGGRFPELRAAESATPESDWIARAPAAPVPAALVSAAPSGIASGAAVTVQEPQDCLSRGRNSSVNSSSSDGRRVVKWSGRNCSGEALIEGDVEFDDTFTTITHISSGGRFTIKTDEDGTERSVDIRPSSSGVTYEYRVNGSRQELDAAGREWLAQTFTFMFRRLGFMAEERASSMLRRGGPAAVLAEVDRLHSDYVRAAYLGVLVEQGRLDPATLERVLTLAADRLESDYYLSEVITEVPGNYAITDAVRDAYIDAVGGIESDYYRHNAFSTLLEAGGLNAQQVSDILRETGRIESDYYRAALLEKLTAEYSDMPGMRDAYLDAAASMESDYYRANVITRLLGERGIPASEMSHVLNAATQLESDYYLQQVLARVAAQELDDAALLALINAAESIESEYYQSELLVAIARRHPLRGQVRTRFEEVTRGIASDVYRGRVASELLGR